MQSADGGVISNKSDFWSINVLYLFNFKHLAIVPHDVDKEHFWTGWTHETTVDPQVAKHVTPPTVSV